MAENGSDLEKLLKAINWGRVDKKPGSPGTYACGEWNLWRLKIRSNQGLLAVNLWNCQRICFWPWEMQNISKHLNNRVRGCRAQKFQEAAMCRNANIVKISHSNVFQTQRGKLSEGNIPLPRVVSSLTCFAYDPHASTHLHPRGWKIKNALRGSGEHPSGLRGARGSVALSPQACPLSRAFQSPFLHPLPSLSLFTGKASFSSHLVTSVFLNIAPYCGERQSNSLGFQLAQKSQTLVA